MLPLLEAEADVLAPDMPGFGRSPPLPGAPTPEAIGDAVEQEMDRAGWRDAHVAGNSLGGWVALELARRGRARTVAAFSPAGLWTPRESAYCQALLRLTRAVASPHTPAELLRPLPMRVVGGAVMFGRPWRADPEEMAEQARMLARSPAFEETRRLMHRAQPRGLDAIDCPVLIAWGTRDRLLLPRQARRWVRLLPRAELRWLPGLGHIPMPDDPELVARTILDFAKR